MAHEQKRALVASQHALQRFQTEDVQMVRRLVQDQEIRVRNQQRRKARLGAFAAGQDLHGLEHVVRADVQVRKHRAHVRFRKDARAHDVFQHRLLRVQHLLVVLAEVADSNARADLHAVAREDFSNERGLPAAVRADQRRARAGWQHKRRVLQKRMPARREPKPRTACGQTAGNAARRAQMDADGDLLARPLLLLQPLQPRLKAAPHLVNLALHVRHLTLVQPRFAVAHAPGQVLLLRGVLHLALNHLFNARLLCLVSRVLVARELQPPLLLPPVGGVAAGILRDAPVLQLADARAHRVQQRAVVRYQHNRARVGLQPLFKQLHACLVQVHRRLVRQQNLTAAGQRARDAPPRALAAGQPVALLARGKLAFQKRVHALVVHVRVAQLRKQRHRAKSSHLALVGHQLARQHAQKRALPRAVLAHQTHAFAVVQLKPVNIQHPAQRVIHAHARRFQKQFTHTKNLPAAYGEASCAHFGQKKYNLSETAQNPDACKRAFS